MTAVLWVFGAYVALVSLASVLGEWRNAPIRRAIDQAEAERDAWRTLARELAGHVATLVGRSE